MRIQDVMSKNVVSIPEETAVAAARERLRSEEIDHLVVVDGKRVVGVVAGKDLKTGHSDLSTAPRGAVLRAHRNR